MDLNHVAAQALPSLIPNDRQSEQGSTLRALRDVIASISSAIRTDLENVQITSYTSADLPAASEEYVGKACLYTSGTDPQIYRVCCITGTSPTAYGWKVIAFS